MLPSTPLGPREETYHSGQALLAILAPLLIPSYAFMGKEIFHSGWESQTISCIMWSWIRYSINWLDPSSTTFSSVGLLEESLSIVCSSHPPLPTDNDEYPLFRDSNETTYPAYCLIEEETSSPLDPSIRNWIFIFQRSPGFLSFLVDRVGRALSLSPIPPPMNELWAGTNIFVIRLPFECGRNELWNEIPTSRGDDTIPYRSPSTISPAAQSLATK